MWQGVAGRRYLTWALTGLLTLAAFVALPLRALADSSTSPAVVPPDSDPFYAPPAGFASLPPGTIIRSRGVSISAVGAKAAYQLLYRTTDANGEPTATVATVVVPSAPAPGPRRLVSYQIAEDSLTRNCAPSYALRNGMGNDKYWSLALAQGWDVVIPDYEGPQSELLVAPMEGRETLDGVRAAENFPLAGLPGRATEVGIMGASGGSVPSLWAGALAPTYAPDINLVANTAGMPAADYEYIVAHIDGSALFGDVILALVGLDRAYPQIDLPSLLNARGNAIAASDAKDASGCGDNGTLVQTAGGTAAQYTNYPTSSALAAVPRLKSVLQQMSLVQAPAPKAPTLIVGGRQDEIMFAPQVDELSNYYCAAGTTVDYLTVPGDHIAAGQIYLPTALQYLGNRFAGQAAPNTCATRPPATPTTTRPSKPAGRATCPRTRTIQLRLPRSTRSIAVFINGHRTRKWRRTSTQSLIINVTGTRAPFVLRVHARNGRSSITIIRRYRSC